MGTVFTAAMTDATRRVFDSIDSGLLWYDADLHIIDANRAARQALALPDGPIGLHEEHLGWHQADETGAELPREKRPVWRALHEAGDGVVSAVVVVDTPERGRRWMKVNALRVEDVGEARVVASITDLTEERLASAALRETEQLLHMFGEHAVDLMWIIDPRAQKLLYINSAYERLWGRSPAPLFENLAHWLDGIDPEDRPRVEQAAQVQTAAGTYESEYRVNRPDGRVLWIRGRGFPLYGPDGRMRYMAGFAEDITLARAAEALRAAHRRAQERLERIVATAPGAVHTYRRLPGGQGHFTFASPVIRELLGVDAATLVARHVDLMELVYADDRPQVAESLRASAEGGSAWLCTFRVTRTPAGERSVEAHSMPVREDDGTVVFHGFFIDVTERRRAEEQIRRLNVELEQRVAERTAELEAKHREMESFTYSVSHDLKAPLRGIDGYSRLLESDHAERLDDEGRLFVAMIRKATGQMGQLIDDLLAYSRVERGRPTLGPVSAASVVAAVTDALAEDGVELVVEADPALQVVGEREGLVLALRNLVENALKFTAGQARRRVEVRARRAGDRGLFEVRDNGLGFDMRYHDRIFEIFQRLHRSEDYPGTGVGLAIVRKAVERMRGRVWATSAPGEGATFFVELPLADVGKSP